MAKNKHVCCGQPMKSALGLKTYTDPKCQQGRRVRHASACGCTYRHLYACKVCRRQEVDGEIAPYLLADIFYI